MEAGTNIAKRELAAKHLQSAHDQFQAAIGDLYKSARVYPVLEAYVEKVYERVEEDAYGIGGIPNVIDLLEDSDQEQPSAEAVEKVL